MSLLIRIVIFCSLAVVTSTGFSQRKITISSSPNTATISVNGSPVGTGAYILNLKPHFNYIVEVSEGGYISQTRKFTYAKKPKHANSVFTLAVDPAFNSTSASEYVNRSISLEVKDKRSHEDAWKVLTRTVFSYFDIIESNDKSSGYLRTSWVGTTWPYSTTRIRVIIKKEVDDPIAFSLKFISEIGPAGVQFSDDAKFKPYGRIPKRYDGFVEELMTKLKN